MSKSRSGKTPNSNQNAQPTTAQNAIIPGKFMESDWNELLEIEDDENFISEIIDEITDSALNQVFDKIIQSRVQPHTVLAARELLLDIIEWQFLQSDPGEINTHEKLSWIEDDEPSDCVIDNWAQGAVPMETHEHIALLESDVVSEVIEEDDEESEIMLATNNIDENVQEIYFESLILEDNIQEENTMEANTVAKNLVNSGRSSMDISQDPGKRKDAREVTSMTKENHVPVPLIKNKSKKYRPHVGSLPNFKKISLESVTDLRPKPGTRVSQKSTLSDFQLSSELLVRNQYGRSSGPKEVIYDEKGNVVKVEKLNVANFPKHRIPVKYSIVDTEKEMDKSIHFNAKSPKTKKQIAEKNILKRNKINAKTLLQKMHTSSTWEASSIPQKTPNACMQYTLEARSPLPPLMVDSMNVTDGVTIREGGLSKQVIKKITLETSVENRSIYPICSSNNRVLEVKDIVSDTSPTFHYITVAEPLTGM